MSAAWSRAPDLHKLQPRDVEFLIKGIESPFAFRPLAFAFILSKQFKKSSLPIHYCSSRYKDKTQLKNRLIRRAKNYSKEFDQITEEGLVVRGRIIARDGDSTSEITQYLSKVFEVDSDLIEIDSETNTIYTHWKIAEVLGSEMEKKYFDIIQSIEIIHQYPYKNGLITYLEPIYETQ